MKSDAFDNWVSQAIVRTNVFHKRAPRNLTQNNVFGRHISQTNLTSNVKMFKPLSRNVAEAIFLKHQIRDTLWTNNHFWNPVKINCPNNHCFCSVSQAPGFTSIVFYKVSWTDAFHKHVAWNGLRNCLSGTFCFARFREHCFPHCFVNTAFQEHSFVYSGPRHHASKNTSFYKWWTFVERSFGTFCFFGSSCSQRRRCDWRPMSSRRGLIFKQHTKIGSHRGTRLHLGWTCHAMASFKWWKDEAKTQHFFGTRKAG